MQSKNCDRPTETSKPDVASPVRGQKRRPRGCPPPLKGTSQNLTVLTPTQAKAVELRVAGRNITDIAQASGVARETVHTWLKLPAFQAALYVSWEPHREKLQRLYAKALEGLEADLDSPLPAVRQRAQNMLFAEHARYEEAQQRSEDRQKAEAESALEDEDTFGPSELSDDELFGLALPQLRRKNNAEQVRAAEERERPNWLTSCS